MSPTRESKQKGDVAVEDDRKGAKVERKATTMYLEPEILAAFKKRVVDEPGHGYEIVEEMIKGYLQFRPDVVRALWNVKEKNKRALYKVVEDALADHLQKLKLL